MRYRSAPLLALLAILAGCTQFPQLDAVVSEGAKTAPYPTLVPVESLTAQVGDPLIQPSTQSTIETRVARLRARANRLRGPVVDSRTRQRMRAGVTE